MIQQKTCLILGAGASMDFGYPSGVKLFDKICKITDEGNVIWKILQGLTKNPSILREFRYSLMHSGRKSIDEFLEHRKEFEHIGKLAIAASLIPYEIKSKLFEGSGNGQNWYKLLFSRMTTDCNSVDDILNNKISFITFNYDRSLEQFLFISVRNSFGTTFEKAVEIVRGMNIIHLHGILGSPACINVNAQKEVEEKIYDSAKGSNDNKKFYRDYDPFVNDTTILNSSAGLKIIHNEQSKEQFEIAINEIRNSRNVHFLGFGYHPLNLRRLRIFDLPNTIATSGTVFGLRAKEVEQITIDTNHRLMEVNLKDCEIEDYFRGYYSLK